MKNTIPNRIASVVLSVFLALGFLLVTPQFASAGGLWSGVSCTGANCELCNVIQLGNAVITWLITVLFVVFGIVALIAGFNLVTSAGNPAGKNAAKDKLINAIIGLVIVLGSWMLVDTIMRTLDDGIIEYNGGFLIWNRVECGLSSPTNSGIDPSAAFDPISAQQESGPF